MSKVLQIIFKLFLINFFLISVSKAELIKPRNDIKPADVIKIQLTGLQKNDSKNDPKNDSKNDPKNQLLMDAPIITPIIAPLQTDSNALKKNARQLKKSTHKLYSKNTCHLKKSELPIEPVGQNYNFAQNEGDSIC